MRSRAAFLSGFVLLLAWFLFRRPMARPRPAWQVRIHPPGPWYVGDVLSWEAMPLEGQNEGGGQVRLRIDPPLGPTRQASLQPRGWSKTPVAAFPWAWDTTSASPGVHTFILEVLQGNRPQRVYQGTLYLWPASRRPLEERRTAWALEEMACCRIWYFRYTETERDLPRLRRMARQVYEEMQARFPEPISRPMSVVFTPRWWGQGGFTWEDIWVSYRDRSPVPGLTLQILRHEAVHWFWNARDGHPWLPALLAEGLAVYMTQGHYRAGEDLYQRTRALLQTRRYIPLPRLARDFYQHQHEVAYIEAGALVQYLVQSWGWSRFWRFLTTLEPPRPGEDEVQALERHLARMDTTLNGLDAELRMAVFSRHLSAEAVEDLELTLALFETLRAYQRLLDPDAYYQTAWFPRRKPLQTRGLVADAMRSPNTALHATLELLLQDAARAWQQGQPARAWQDIEAVRTVLAQFELYHHIQTWPERAWRVRRWVAWARACGGDIQQLRLESGQAWLRFPALGSQLWPWRFPRGEQIPNTCPRIPGQGIPVQNFPISP